MTDPQPTQKPLHPSEWTGVTDVLGIEFEEVSAERVVATMPVTPRHHQPFGYLHGGVSVVLAESAASVGAYLAAPPGYGAMGVEINANHVRSMRTGRLRAVAAPVHVGRRTQVWTIDLRDSEGRLICTSRCTLAVVEQPDAS
ncbi:hotdog fold thioesterase [Salisaeta longa]|uniref:hotdog fold thioesterase n=1 Tax=Salisaeta longa TaxID=503170 RepID=UPI0003B79B58|nr:hotdog fold thioesterase [Salisaeta longa]